MKRLDFHLGAVELFVALIVLNAGLLALMSAFQSGSLGPVHRGGSHSPPAVTRPAVPQVSLTLRALER